MQFRINPTVIGHSQGESLPKRTTPVTVLIFPHCVDCVVNCDIGVNLGLSVIKALSVEVGAFLPLEQLEDCVRHAPLVL